MKNAGSRFAQITAALLLLLLGLSFFMTGSGGMVAWDRIRAVAFESDDWGFCGYVPDSLALKDLDLVKLTAGRYPAVYNGSTLETAAMIDDLAEILSSTQGNDGLSAVFQANYILSSLEYDPTAPGSWRPVELPLFATHYARPKLWDAVDRAVQAGVWWPEYHGYLHYDPDKRKAAVASDQEAIAAAEAGITLFPGGNRAFELGASRTDVELRRELQAGSRVFRSIFGRVPLSIIAPDYRWQRKDELRWVEAGFISIQAKKEQRSAEGARPGSISRLLKYLERSWRRLTEKRIVYLERNCRLEIVQTTDTDALLRNCLDEVRTAWQRGEPAIIETHRINFVHIDPKLVEHSLGVFKTFLDSLVVDPEALPFFLTDQEIAMLNRSGTSYRIFGDTLILRNFTHSSRLLVFSLAPGSIRKYRLLAPGSYIYSHNGNMLKKVYEIK